jgi:hypothetical protein
MTTRTYHIDELLELLELTCETAERMVAAGELGGCWNCGRPDCPEPDGESCHAYVASVEIPDEGIPF